MKMEEKGLVFAMPLSWEWVFVLIGKGNSNQVVFAEAEVENACMLDSVPW